MSLDQMWADWQRSADTQIVITPDPSELLTSLSVSEPRLSTIIDAETELPWLRIYPFQKTRKNHERAQLHRWNQKVSINMLLETQSISKRQPDEVHIG